MFLIFPTPLPSVFARNCKCHYVRKIRISLKHNAHAKDFSAHEASIRDVQKLAFSLALARE